MRPQIHLFRSLFDDAALFPPGNAAMNAALISRNRHRQVGRSKFIGPFVVPGNRLAELADSRSSRDDDRLLDLAVTVTGGIAAVSSALRVVEHIPQVRAVAIEVATEPGSTTADIGVGLATVVPEGIRVFVEIPLDGRQLSSIDGLVGSGILAKFRTGGTERSAYPDEKELAACIHRAVSLEVPFKATAGLHRAIRNTNPANGFEQHGFLNLLAGVGVALTGATVADIAAVLARRDGEHVAAELARLDLECVSRIRSRFFSFGTYSIDEPLEDIARLGLVPATDLLDATAETLA
ncbi:hypothetical protein [Mycobacterium sp. 1465703.0]|uniref:hypothetical protein n=1 Tax=Mycobacterium sp. 1465703.0 TaxID=1834078 RepID=UPI0007FCA130|nr:hypothetical protein [Mycobacterium sp. 1465703.0]OBJ01022.1 hypothetical protein A5625_25950 [Mycobacterium sp. 1465703.0]